MQLCAARSMKQSSSNAAPDNRTDIVGRLGCVALLLLFGFGWVQMKSIRSPVAGMPSPSGPCAVGTTSLVVGPSATWPSSITVELWYPAGSGRVDDKQCIAAGVRETDQRSVPSARRPLLLYAPGWASDRNDNSAFLAELASRGYVIAALDDIGLKPSRDELPVPDARAHAGFSFATPDLLAKSKAVANWRLERMLEKLTSVLDALLVRNQMSAPWPFGGRIAEHAIGVIGFSFGGSVAVEMALRDPRIAAAVNLDGWLFGQSAERATGKPILFLNSDFPDIEGQLMSRVVSKRLLAGLMAADRTAQARHVKDSGAQVLQFEGIEHGDFTDKLFEPWLDSYRRQWTWPTGARAAFRAHVNDYVRQFLDQNVRAIGPGQVRGSRTQGGIRVIAR